MTGLQLSIRKQPFEDYLNRQSKSKTQLSFLASKTIDFYLKNLHTHPNHGLPQQKIKQSEFLYGRNILAKKQLKTIFQIFCQTLQDLMLRILIISAIFSIIIEAIYSTQRQTFWLQGVTILVAVVICTLVATINDYQKQKQFQQLNNISQKSNKFDVIRNGKSIQIFKDEIVVGDLLKIYSGLQIPIDGLALKANDLIIDQSSMTGESIQVYKDILDKCLMHDEDKNGPSPVILSGSKIMSGQGLMVCLLVGKDHRQGEINQLIQVEGENQTPLEEKLEALAENIGWFGLFSGLMLFVILLVWLLVTEIIPQGFHSDIHIADILSYLMLAVTLIVVAVPQGLPLAVTLSLAYSIQKMLQEKNLVKRLACCQTMGSAHVICTDKTGTLTQNNMNVVEVWNGKRFKIADGITTSPFSNHPSEYKDLIFSSIISNSSSTLHPKPKGSATQIALLKYANEFYSNKDLLQQSRKNQQNIFLRFPFNSDRKRITTGLNYHDKKIIFLTGGSEIVLSACDKIYGQQSLGIDRGEVKEEIDRLTKRGLRVMALAMKEVKVEVGDEGKDKFGVREIEKSGFTLLLLAGIQDLLRPQSKEAIAMCNRAGVVVIMVTGDSSITARAVGDELGITQAGDTTPGLCMQGEQFQKLVTNSSPSQFYQQIKHLKILSRSRPQHKLKLVQGLKKLNNIVAVTGDGTNDAPALLKANVGVAMGISGTQVAKNAADILILDDNFNSIVRSIVWGRNIYESIKKFIQFQLTINIVVCVFTIISSSIFRQSIFTTVQMLWVNMIMDSLASLALSTDPPNTEELLSKKPINRSENLITPTMIKHIVIQSLYQIILLLFLVLYGQHFLKEYPDEYDQLIGTDLSAKYYQGQVEGTMANGLFHPLSGESYQPYFNKYHIYSRHLTFIYNVLVFLQIFNFFNCRKINDELNILSGLFNNYIFWCILIFIIIFQWMIIYFLNIYFKCYSFHGLTIQQWLLSLLFGFTVIPLSIFIRLLPFAKVEDNNDVNDKPNNLQFREGGLEINEKGIEKDELK